MTHDQPPLLLVIYMINITLIVTVAIKSVMLCGKCMTTLHHYYCTSSCSITVLVNYTSYKLNPSSVFSVGSTDLVKCGTPSSISISTLLISCCVWLAFVNLLFHWLLYNAVLETHDLGLIANYTPTKCMGNYITMCFIWCY